MARHDRLCAIAALAIVALSGCGARQGAASQPTSTTTPQATTTTTAAATAPSAASGPRSPAPLTGGESSPPNQDNRCTAENLSGTVEPQDADAGNRYATLVVRNTGKQTCTLWGYGGLELLAAGRTPIPTQAERTLGPVPTLVTLRPGAAAGKILHWSVIAADDEPSDGPCQPVATSINVIPPDENEPFEVDFEFGSVCDHGRMETSAYFPR